jgi:primosomal protein N'
MFESIDDFDIILATNRAITLTHPKIGIIVFLIFEINLSIPEYDIEEITYAEITHLKRQNKPLYIQTYMPDHPLLEEITQGNYRSFMEYTKKERAMFLYPPFSELATLRIHDENKERVKSIIANLVNKIQLSVKESTKVVYDKDIWEKVRNEWTQKIVLRDKNLDYLINLLEVEIVRNRAVTLEWH